MSPQSILLGQPVDPQRKCKTDIGVHGAWQYVKLPLKDYDCCSLTTCKAIFLLQEKLPLDFYHAASRMTTRDCVLSYTYLWLFFFEPNYVNIPQLLAVIHHHFLHKLNTTSIKPHLTSLPITFSIGEALDLIVYWKWGHQTMIHCGSECGGLFKK